MNNIQKDLQTTQTLQQALEYLKEWNRLNGTMYATKYTTQAKIRLLENVRKDNIFNLTTVFHGTITIINHYRNN